MLTELRVNHIRGGRRLLTTLEIESMWICSLLHVIAAVAAPAATADVTVQHVVSPVVSKAPGAPTNPAGIDWNRDDHSGKIHIDRSLTPALRGRVGAINEVVLAPGKTNNKRRMQKDDIFQKDAAKTRAHLEKIAEMELKNRVKEANEAAKAAEKEEKEAAKAAEKEESERIKDDEEASTDAEDFSHFLEPEIETESATVPEAEAEDFLPMPELLVDTVSEPEFEDKDFLHMSEQNTMPEPKEEAEDLFHMPEPETKTMPEPATDADHIPGPEIRTEKERSRQVPNLNSSQGGIRNMTSGGKFGMSLVFISLFALILVAAFRSRSRHTTSKGEKYWEMNDQTDGTNKYDVAAFQSRSRRTGNRKRGKYLEMDDQTDDGTSEFYADTNTDTNTATDINVEAMEELDDIIDQITTAPTQGTDEGFEIW